MTLEIGERDRTIKIWLEYRGDDVIVCAEKGREHTRDLVRIIPIEYGHPSEDQIKVVVYPDHNCGSAFDILI